jgi:hypothetical protein
MASTHQCHHRQPLHITLTQDDALQILDKPFSDNPGLSENGLVSRSRHFGPPYPPCTASALSQRNAPAAAKVVRAMV